MKNLRSLFGAIMLLFALFAITSCGHSHEGDGSHSHGEKSEESIDKSGPEYTSAYICPMHCEGSGSDKAGECPVCGMAYVANENYKAKDGDGHDHDDDHDGHNH